MLAPYVQRLGIAACALSGLALLVAALVWASVRTGLDHRVYYDVLYTMAARQATAGATTNAERADRLDQYVFFNVHVPIDEVPDTDGPPAETLLGGYGVCDQQVRLFMALAEKVGLSTREIFLLNSDTGTSPHTTVEVWEDGRWAWLDVLFGYSPKRQDGSPATLSDLVARADPIIPLTGLTPNEYTNNRVQLTMQPNGLGDLLARWMPGWLADRLQDLYLMLPPPVIPAQDGVSHFATSDGRLYWQGRNYQLFGRVSLATRAFQHLVDAFPDSSYANDALYNLALMHESGAPQTALKDLGQLQAHEPPVGIRDDGWYLAGQTYERLGAANCLDAVDTYSRVVSGAASKAPAAIFRLGQTRCTSTLPRPLAQFGPLDLSGLQLDGKLVSLLWHVTAPVTQDYTVFVHALDARGNIVAQDDSQPDGGLLPTSRQRVGALVPDDHALTLPETAVRLEIGAYYLATGERLKQPDGADVYQVTLGPSEKGLGALDMMDSTV
jgi:hypothetical protein